MKERDHLEHLGINERILYVKIVGGSWINLAQDRNLQAPYKARNFLTK